MKKISMNCFEVNNMKKTCDRCPSQWEGSLVDGRMFYARYRWGGLSIRVSQSKSNDVYDAVKGIEIEYVILGSELDGELSENILREEMSKVGFIFVTL